MYLNVVRQKNSTGCGIFAIKYMIGNGATLVKSISLVSPTLVYLHVIIILI